MAGTGTGERTWIRRSPSAPAVATATLVGALLAATPVGAHTGQGLAGAWSGATHPLLGLDHLLAMVVVGLLAYSLDRDWMIPVGFVAAMAAGGALGMVGVGLPGGEVMIALSVVALGAALVASTLHRAAALALVALAGFAHGHAHGVEAPAAAHPVLYVAGFLVATSLLHTAGWFAGVATVRRPRLRTTAGAVAMGLGAGLAVGIL